MFKSILAVLTTLVLVFPVFAQDKFVIPAQKVVGAEELVPANEMVILKVTPIQERPKYLQDVSYSWVVLADGKEKKNVLTFPDNTTVAFTRGSAKKMQALLVINYLYTVKEGDKITEVGQKTSGIIFTDIKFDGSAPTPPDNPDNPTPDLPEGKFALAKDAYNLAVSKVKVESRAKGAAAIATKTEGIVSSIRAGALKDPAEILTTAKEANNRGLSEAKVPLEDWDAYGVGMQEKLVQLYRDNKLKTASDYADAFSEIVTGLKAVK